MKKKNSLRSIFFTIHKILGLTTGLVVFIVAITGCCWVFKDEIESLYSDYKSVEARDAQMLTATEAKEIAETVIPGRSVHGTLFGREDEAMEVIFYEAEPEFYQSIFLNPYSGEVLHRKDHLSGFFGFVLDGHLHLWLPHKIGSQIEAFSILIFMLMLISGMILWWPKNNKNRKQRFRFEWKKTTRWKRKNFDLHAILGFYTFSLAFVLAFTGSVMAYDWFYYLTYKAWGGSNAPQFIVPDGSKYARGQFMASEKPIDQLIPKLKVAHPAARSFEIHYPHSDSASIYVEVSNSEGIYYNSDYRFFDQNTLEEIPTSSIYGKYNEATLADRIIRMNYDIHVGAIGGLPGKIIAFLISLLIATLPVSGTLLWYGRQHKSRKSTRKEQKNFQFIREKELIGSPVAK
jgi:uncharacterized iron-regulated membrane protein